MGALFTLAASVSTAISKQEKGEPWILARRTAGADLALLGE